MSCSAKIGRFCDQSRIWASFLASQRTSMTYSMLVYWCLWMPRHHIHLIQGQGHASYRQFCEHLLYQFSRCNLQVTSSVWASGLLVIAKWMPDPSSASSIIPHMTRHVSRSSDVTDLGWPLMKTVLVELAASTYIHLHYQFWEFDLTSEVTGWAMTLKLSNMLNFSAEL